MDSKNNPTTELLNIISKAADTKMYGSVEVYIEDGQITQITQRIIKKISRPKSVLSFTKSKKTISTVQRKNAETSLEFQS